MKKTVIICLVVLSVAAGQAVGAPRCLIPEWHPIRTVHLNTGQVRMGPTNPTYIVGFADGLHQITEPWHWETETHNCTSQPISFTCGWYGLGGFSRSYQINLQPGASFYTHFSLTEVPEVGAHTYSMFCPAPTSIWHDTIQECSVIEPDVARIEGDGDFVEIPGLEPADCDGYVMIEEQEPPYCTEYSEMDFNMDCIVNFVDFAFFADAWLDCTLWE